jgi:hypothetical protein
VVSGLPNITPIFSRIWLMKMTVQSGLGDGAGELAHRLAHEAGLQADVGVAHLALDLRLGDQGGDGVDDDDVDRVGADEHFADFQALLAGVGLTDEQVVDVDAQPRAQEGSRACSASMNAATPPAFWAWATTVQRERGLAGIPGRRTRRSARGGCRARPAPGRARWRRSLMPGGMLDGSSFSFMIDPLPKARSIWVTARSTAAARPSASGLAAVFAMALPLSEVFRLTVGVWGVMVATIIADLRFVQLFGACKDTDPSAAVKQKFEFCSGFESCPSCFVEAESRRAGVPGP